MLNLRLLYFRRRCRRADRSKRQASNQWNIAEQKLPQLPDIIVLKAELQRMLSDIQLLKAAQYQAHTDAVLSIYRDSYQQGERYIPSEEEMAQFETLLVEQYGLKQRNYKLNRQFSGSNLFNSQYLHEYIRQEIHKENKNTYSQNGHRHQPNGIKQ